MYQSQPPPYILQELPDITEAINYPIKNVQRIKYTCFDVSKTLIAFGATSGGIYVFNRNPCEFLQLIPNKDGAITRVAISSKEKHIGYANGRGTVTVTECTQSLSSGHSIVSRNHHGNEVTAMAWSDNMLFTGDDVGKISVLLLQSFIVKTFQNAAEIIMSLDSRICQIDCKASMLLVSTLTRCYICDTSQEQYRQIGQKLRDGEFGACFVNKEKYRDNTAKNPVQDLTEVKKFNMVNDESKFAVSKELNNTLIFCARPSSRLWEASVDGTVKRTHQFKQVLARKPMKILSVNSYKEEKPNVGTVTSDEEGQSVSFSKIFSMDSAIFCYRKDALYFLNIDNVDDTIWYDSYRDIVDCKIHNDMLYVWMSNGALINLKFIKIDKFLIKCYLDEKYVLCAEMCILYNQYLLSQELSSKIHILVGLRDKLHNKELLNNITSILAKIEKLKCNDSTSKSGIVVVDNTFHAQSSLDDDDCAKPNEDFKFTTITPEAMQTLKDLSITVSDKLNNSKKMFKEKWGDFEGKIKHLSTEKQHTQDIIVPKRPTPSEEVPSANQRSVLLDEEIVYKGSSQKAIEEVSICDTDKKYDKVIKSLYQYFRLHLLGKETDQTNLISIIETCTCDISEICNIMILLKEYFASIGAIEESKYIPNTIFLSYLNVTPRKDKFMTKIIKEDELYAYFVDSCIVVNMRDHNLSSIGCECGFPLPYATRNKTPCFSELIDDFIELQWSSPTKDQCYDICKKMPFSWRKILYLRRNEDLSNILTLILQMLDENLLNTFLPQFTMDIWKVTVQLYATLHSNMCLNCSKRFDHVSVKDMLSWDDLGALMIKSIGGKNAISVMEEFAHLIEPGTVTVKFYHTCLLVIMFEKYDATAINQLTDAIYSSYDCEEARTEICKILRDSCGKINNTALPLAVASRCTCWGLKPSEEKRNNDQEHTTQSIHTNNQCNMERDLACANMSECDCTLCGLALSNLVLMKDGGLWVFKCGHIYHGACLSLNTIKLCPACPVSEITCH